MAHEWAHCSDVVANHQLSRDMIIFIIFYLCTHCIIPESLLSHPNSFSGGIFKLNAKFDADSLLYSLSHFECNSHTVHMLTQQHPPPPLTPSEVIIVHTCAFQSMLLGCQVASMSCKLFSL